MRSASPTHSDRAAQPNRTATGRSGTRISSAAARPDRCSQPSRVAELNRIAQPARLTQPDDHTKPTRVAELNRIAQPARLTQRNHHTDLARLTQPDHHSEPARLTQPDRHTDLARLTQPDHHSEPARLTQPDHHSEPARLTQPDHHSEPDRLTQPDHHSEPDRLTQPDRHTELVRLTQPDHHTKLARLTQPDNHTELARLTQPDNHTELARLTQPDHHTKLARLTQPDRHTELARLTQPDHHSEPDRLTRPDHHSELARLTQPDHHSKPARLTQPDRHTELARLTQPDRHTELVRLTQPNQPRQLNRAVTVRERYPHLQPVARLCILPLILAATALAADPTYFVQASDPQFGMFTDNANFTQETANWTFAIANINRLHPAFLVVTGDLTNKAGDADQIAEYKRINRGLDPAIHLYSVPGNHDQTNTPTPETVAAYRKNHGPDYYSFREPGIYGIVLNSTLFKAPENVAAEEAKELQWLEAELPKAQASGATIAVFMHHAPFVSKVDEPSGENLPPEIRKTLLAMFHKYGVHYVFAGHLHKNATASDGDLQIIITCAAGRPLGDDPSGFRLAELTPTGIVNKYYGYGSIPNQLPDLTK